jgi:hypothetical protein
MEEVAVKLDTAREHGRGSIDGCIIRSRFKMNDSFRRAVAKQEYRWCTGVS